MGKDEQFRKLLLSSSWEGIQVFVDDPNSPHQNKGEKTLILYRL